MLIEFVGDALPLFSVRRRRLFSRDIWPNLRIFGIDAEPLFQTWLGVRLDRVNRAFRLAYAAIDAFVRVDDQHVFALVKAIDRANLNAVHVFAFDAIVVDDIGHLHTLDARSEALLLSHVVRGTQEGAHSRRVSAANPSAISSLSQILVKPRGRSGGPAPLDKAHYLDHPHPTIEGDRDNIAGSHHAARRVNARPI